NTLASPASVATLKPDAPVGAWPWTVWRARRGISPLWLVLTPVIVIILGLLVTVFWLSTLKGLPGTVGTRLTWENYASLYTDPFAAHALSNTLGFAGTGVVLALIIGISIAWLVERTDLPGKSAVYV